MYEHWWFVNSERNEDDDDRMFSVGDPLSDICMVKLRTDGIRATQVYCSSVIAHS